MSKPPAHNHLKGTNSPYLLQHATNPVAWYPWGEKAFSRARSENKPIFLSIGYSSCHWCHVMAHESFEDPGVAEILNHSFISIKVDREERPDIDAVYMAFAQAMTGAGGWPLTIVMTPDKEPFFAATYIPKNRQFGRRGITEILEEIEILWKNKNKGVRDSAGKLRSAMEQQTNHAPEGTFSGEEIHTAFKELSGTFDEQYGGFGIAPKFPSPHTIVFLLKYGKSTGNSEAQRMAVNTLDAMMAGGICDHIGGGFHRYSVTRDWRIPHFEKMVYDQAMILYAYTEGWNATGNETYKTIAEDTADYLITNMQAEEGGFFSAEDADSENTEGAAYLWTYDELREAAGEYAEEVLARFDIRRNGNSAEETHGLPRGKKTLAFASRNAANLWYTSKNRTAIRNKLRETRNRRPPPFCDKKILTDWNGLCIGALAYAGNALHHPEYITAAKKAADTIPYTDSGKPGELLHSRYRGVSSGKALLDDYAFVLWGYLMLYEATFDAVWLEKADNLTAVLTKQFRSPQGGYYLTADGAETPLMKQKIIYDGAIPSGNSMAAVSLVLFARITAEIPYEEDAIRIFGAFAPEIQHAPSGHCHLLSAYLHIKSGEEYLIVPGQEGTASLLDVLSHGYHPFRTITVADKSPAITAAAPFTRTLKKTDGKTTLYICRDGTCSVPFTDFDAIDDYPLSDPFSPCTTTPEH